MAPGLSKTKLVIRNVAFEASKKELMGLCTPFGHVKELRVPRKFDGTHRRVCGGSCCTESSL